MQGLLAYIKQLLAFNILILNPYLHLYSPKAAIGEYRSTHHVVDTPSVRHFSISSSKRLTSHSGDKRAIANMSKVVPAGRLDRSLLKVSTNWQSQKILCWPFCDPAGWMRERCFRIEFLHWNTQNVQKIPCDLYFIAQSAQKCSEYLTSCQNGGASAKKMSVRFFFSLNKQQKLIKNCWKSGKYVKLK